ncbi:hypothetical protein KLP40_07975 [Hymenobacter sp. NST-14]|uniref:hypothetical protein n=1 Tax=Hymenobacter piscis TaxID=2839984 RepID=UPI001C028521|nr:hypothetical protein [Hymenobacter piscis]MBT9393098.1 hypothetical protein [Hymenobacter piscis]
MSTRYSRLLQLLLSCWLLVLADTARSQTIRQPDSTFRTQARRYAPPYAAAYRPDGSCLVLGPQTHVADLRVGNLVCLRPDGSVDAAFQRQLGELQASTEYVAFPPRLLAYPDGRVLVLGINGLVISGNRRIAAAGVRLLASGRPDSSFVVAARPPDWPQVLAVALQADGSILLGGLSSTGTALIRLGPDGQRDTSFAPRFSKSNGSVQVNALAVQPDGRILVGGSFESPDQGLVRLLPDGSPDPSFQAGLAKGQSVQALALRPDGRVVVAGVATLQLQGRVGGIQQLLADGQADPDFQAPAAYGIAQFQGADRLQLQPDGGLLVVPTQPAGAPLLRLLPDGRPDTGFQLPVRLSLTVQQLAAGSGPPLLAGVYNHQPGPQGPLLRLQPSGLPDDQFHPQLVQAGRVEAQQLLPDGRVALVGEFDLLDGVRAGNLGCLLPTGLPDTAFARRSPFLAGSPSLLALQPGGGLLIGGSFRVGTSSRGALVRVGLDGQLDTTRFARFSADDYLSALAAQPDGRVLLGGNLAQKLSRSWFCRLLPSGDSDWSFGLDAGLSTRLEEARQVLPLPDGKILLVGRKMYRVQNSGWQDTSFDPVEVNTMANFLARYTLVLPDGRILVCGQVPRHASHTSSRASIARLLPTGRLDSTFQDNLYPVFFPRSLYAQPDGRLLAGGGFAANYSAGLVAVVRLREDGGFDGSGPDLPGSGNVFSIGSDAQGRILLAGDFDSNAGLAKPLLGLARLPAGGVVTARARPLAGPVALQCYPNPARNSFGATWAQVPRRLQLLNLLGQPVRELPVTAGATGGDWSLRGLAAGLYVVRADFDTGPAVNCRLMIEP